ncbi:MAG: MotA/TolQ/ExbB proton channel family protein [Proteobacteria bacterium]|nr:MotA/TolQ/ExbB proton channel family protein [Pseudomonadota bacterium]
MDIASFAGIISGISLIISAIVIGGDVHNFINIQGLMIVAGGTVATTLLTFQLKDVAAAFKAAYFVFKEDCEDPNKIIANMIKLCHISRKQGILELSNIKTNSSFLKKACNLIADGSEIDVILSSLRTEISSLKMRHLVVQDVFRKMGIYSPTFGMIGTLIGLVQMLSKLSDPSTIGPSMAVALLTTFYGSLGSALFFLPIAGKLKSRTIREVINHEIMLEGSLSILKSNNPIIVYEKLSSFVPAKGRTPLSKINVKPDGK